MAWPDGWTIASSWGKGIAPVGLRQHRAADGLAGGLDDLDDLAPTLTAPVVRDGGRRDRLPITVVQSLDTKRGGPDDNEAQAGHLIAFRKATKAHDSDDWERWESADMTDGLTANGLAARTATAVVSPTLRVGPAKIADGGPGDTVPLTVGDVGEDDPLLPLGLDSHRYRCCGNGVVASVSEWLGHRLLEAMS